MRRTPTRKSAVNAQSDSRTNKDQRKTDAPAPSAGTGAAELSRCFVSGRTDSSELTLPKVKPIVRQVLSAVEAGRDEDMADVSFVDAAGIEPLKELRIRFTLLNPLRWWPSNSKRKEIVRKTFRLDTANGRWLVRPAPCAAWGSDCHAEPNTRREDTQYARSPGTAHDKDA